METRDNNPERYVGFGKLLDLPSGRIGLQLTINNIREIYEELMTKHNEDDKIFLLVLPVKPQNITKDKSHSVKIGESKYKQNLINEH